LHVEFPVEVADGALDAREPLLDGCKRAGHLFDSLLGPCHTQFDGSQLFSGRT
jgi:hypothetical protein